MVRADADAKAAFDLVRSSNDKPVKNTRFGAFLPEVGEEMSLAPAAVRAERRNDLAREFVRIKERCHRRRIGPVPDRGSEEHDVVAGQIRDVNKRGMFAFPKCPSRRL